MFLNVAGHSSCMRHVRVARFMTRHLQIAVLLKTLAQIYLVLKIYQSQLLKPMDF